MADKPFIISKDLQVGDGSAAGTTDALLRVDDTNNRVGINTPTPTGTLDVTVSSSGDRGLIVRSVSSQTTKSFEILGANGSGVFSIDPSGSVYFAPWSGTQTSSIKYDASSNGLVFTGSGTSANPIELNVLSDSTLSFEGTAGQLFSVADGLSSGTIFAVSDISGMPSLEIDASGLIKLGEFDGFVGVGTSQTYGQYSGKMEINYPSGYKGLLVRPGSSEIRNALEVQNSSSGTVFSVDPYGATVIDLTTSTTSKGLIIQAATSQSVNLQEWQNSSSTALASVNQEGRFSGVSYNASSGVILQAATPSSTTNTLYNVGGSLYFNGSAVGGSISTLTFGSGLSGSTSSTFDGTSAVTVNLGGTGTLTRLNFSGDTYIYTTNSMYIGYEAGKDTIDDFDNIGIGYFAMGNDGTQAPSGFRNIGIGWSAGSSQRGDGNVYIGSAAGLYNEGSNNLEIIQGADYNKTIIGNYNGPFSNKLNLGSVIVGDTSTKRLAIGNVSHTTLSPNSTLEILPSGASTKSLILKGTVSYATNFLEVQNSSSTANLYIDQNYNLVTTGNVVANSGAFNVLDLTPIPDTNYPAYQEGLVFYDDENKSLTVYNDEADISLQLGQETYLRVRNDSGSGILNGQLVYISGSQGTHPQVGLAIANCVYKSQAVGMATHDIEDSSFGYVTTYGIVRGLDTSGYGSGLPIYLSPTVSGGYTLTAPEPPYFNVHIGHVIRGDSASNGSILIEMESPKFAGLDVTTTSGNINISGIPFYSVSGCAGVAMVTSPSFYYDSGNNKLVVPTGQMNQLGITSLNTSTPPLTSTSLGTVAAGKFVGAFNQQNVIEVWGGSYNGVKLGRSDSAGQYSAQFLAGYDGNGVLIQKNSTISYYAMIINDGSTDKFRTTFDGRMGINTAIAALNHTVTLDITSPSSTTKGIVVKGAVSQTASLLELQNSSSTNLLYANTTGVLTTLPVYAYGNNNGGWAMEVKNTSNFSYGLRILTNNDSYAPYNFFSIQKADATTQYFGVNQAGINTLNANTAFNSSYALSYSGVDNFTFGVYAGGRMANANVNSHNFFYGQWCAGGGSYPVVSTASVNNNFIFGYYTFYNITGVANNNVLFGNNSMDSMLYGSHNFSYGQGTLGSLQVGNYNINIGQAGMSSLATGDYNIAIGQGTSFPATNNYSIAIGRAATVDKSNQLVLGSTSYKIGASSAGETSISSTTPSGISKLLEAKINGTYYNIPLLPSGSTDLQYFSSLKSTASSSTIVPLTLKGAVSQSNNLLEIKNSSDTVLQSVDPSGNVNFGDGQLSRFSASSIVATGSRDLTQSDNGSSLICTDSSAMTLTIPTGLSLGFNCSIVQKGAGQVTVGSGAGVAGYAPDGAKTAKQWAMISIINTGTTDEYVVGGNTAT